MYNLRLTVTKFENEYLLSNRSADEIGQEQDMAYRAQTASSLYMHDLSGVIVLLTAKDLVKYAQGKSANKGKKMADKDKRMEV